MSRNTQAIVDLGALRHNFELARRSAPGSRVMAVIKANAYGHGVLPVAQTLSDAEAFAVTSVEEALPLREAGFAQPIVLLQGMYDDSELSLIGRLGCELVLHSLWQVELLERASLSRPVAVWLKVDSGMHRLGFDPALVRPMYERLRACNTVDRIGFLTHLAAADDRDSDYTEFQLREFERACAGLPGERSIANSAGVLAWPRAHGDWLRPGVMLYGVSPFADGRDERPDLRPVMTLQSRLVAINACRRGDRLGYAGAYTCPENMAVGIVTAGYADGYPRHAGAKASVLLNGRRCPVLGRVSMDMLCVDLRGVEARIHDPVTLWGEGLPIEEVAELSGTIAYELLTKVTGRVRFEYREAEA
ncbi:alanine racemase [Alkalilimnicola ehrlichii]|uniref:Alanine racemase n=1 Tax=Alkalilimnicola ehrlichii TaxID=351052 RepID=A0A3E0X1A5_9GAMM|nr:alanine racemase [Alkalilimnicola ehrlichii]RFA30474.1 alanine racemase [Alkalilimnicola ehrlichii]RFA38025.1 alanine racemase [Alkalilimnicola ehrlichii]